MYFFGAKAFLILAIIIAKIICLGFIVSYKALLPIAGGGKYKLKVILIDSYLI